MVAIVEACQRGELAAKPVIVVSDRPDAPALERAQALGVPTVGLDYRAQASPEAYHRQLMAHLQEADVEWVVLAGYMRILPASFISAYPNRIVNIHPSLLPSFPGLRPHEQALTHGVKLSGATVHLVDEGVDSGPIIIQEAVPVIDDDTPESLAQRVLAVEHRIYPEAIRLLASGTLCLAGRRVFVKKE